MSDHFPAPNMAHPVLMADGTAHPGTVFLKAVIDHPQFIVGDYSYASAFLPPDDWAAHLAPYLFSFAPERLIIGKFCQIADGVRFITASANHRHDGVSTFPFAIFSGPFENRPSMPGAGPDTVIGNDVWLGQGVTVLPGAVIGNGVIASAGSVIRGTIPDYSIVAGNPGTIIRQRFSDEDIARLNQIAWWDWPIDAIVESEALICGGDIVGLEQRSQMIRANHMRG